MKKLPTIFLRLVIVALGGVALVLLLWEPTLEGVNAHATLFEIYFKDPFLAFAYVGSAAFFVALFQAFKILEYIRRGEIFSAPVRRALWTIKYCALCIIGFVAVGEIFIMLSVSDDRAGGVFMGFLITLGSLVAFAVAAVCEAVWMKGVQGK